MNFAIGNLANVMEVYTHDDEPHVGLIIDVVYARDHKIKAVRDVACIPENSELCIVTLSFGDGSTKEYFDDELECVKDV